MAHENSNRDDDVADPRDECAATVAKIIASNIEPETPDQVLAALARLDGQVVTTRLLDQLPGGRVEWRLHKELGVTEIRNRAYLRHRREGIRLTLTKSPTQALSAKFVERENPYYFKERHARNKKRAETLRNQELLKRIGLLFCEIEDLITKTRAAKQQLAIFVGDASDREALERALWRDEDNHKETT
jgi:hypothetical protein